MGYQITIARDDLLKYIQATLMGGMKKSDAYINYIDSNIKNVYTAIRRLENRDDFHEMMQTIIDTDELVARKSMMRVKNKYLRMTEKALDTASDLLDTANEDGATSGDKAQAVRLANETFGAMAIVGVADPTKGEKQTALNKGSVVI